MIEYTETLDSITADDLHGFFVGWPNPPTPATHLRLLETSNYILLAVERETGRVVGFITAISDGVLCAYIPLLEVLPEYQAQGVGSALMERMLAKLSALYMVDTLCDPDLQPFYERFGMRRAVGVCVRRYERQSGVEPYEVSGAND